MKSVPAHPDDSEVEIVRTRRRQARAKETRERIQEAAAKEFAHNGFDGTTTRSIATRAGVRHALVIYHFETKLGIWQAVMKDVLGGFHKTFADRIEGLRGVDDVTKLRLLHADFIRLSAQHPELHWLMSHEAGEGGERITWLMENVLIGDFEMFVHLIKSAQKSGHYVEGDALHLHYIFLGAAARIFMVSGEVETLMGRSPFDPAFVEDHIETCARLFFRVPTRRSTQASSRMKTGA